MILRAALGGQEPLLDRFSTVPGATPTSPFALSMVELRFANGKQDASHFVKRILHIYKLSPPANYQYARSSSLIYSETHLNRLYDRLQVVPMRVSFQIHVSSRSCRHLTLSEIGLSCWDLLACRNSSLRSSLHQQSWLSCFPSAKSTSQRMPIWW